MTQMTVPGMDAVFIGGSWRSSSERALVSVVSPASEEVIAMVADVTEQDAADAATEAHTAMSGPWPRTPLDERLFVCQRFCSELQAADEAIRLAWAADCGMPLSWSTRLHKYGAATAWTQTLASASDALADQVRTVPHGRVLLVREPIGPVLAILPFNGPLPTVALKVLPALLAGCPVVAKAAPESALTARVIAECARVAGFPPGVFSMLPARIEVSEQLTSDSHFSLISLTGGLETARRVLSNSLHYLPKTVLELGGKSPAIILDDADLSEVMRSLPVGTMSASGQVCTTLSRVLVARRHADETTDRLASAYSDLRIGDPMDPTTTHGPLINRRAWERTDQLVQRAKSEGALVITGGGRPKGFAKGHYFEPTLLRKVDPTSTIATVEVFGPVTDIIEFDDDQEALNIANSLDFGLGGSVFAADDETAQRFAKQIRAGSVGVNTVGPSLAAPYGGVRMSGWGREGGAEGILEFTTMKQLLYRPSEIHPRPRVAEGES
jgi:acyl-CoA reductase-like NAD-dependent aldehyde dehydrogenase